MYFMNSSTSKNDGFLILTQSLVEWRRGKSTCRGNYFPAAFPKAFLEKTAFRFLLDQLQRAWVGAPGALASAESAATAGAGGVAEGIISQVAPPEDGADQRQARRG